MHRRHSPFTGLLPRWPTPAAPAPAFASCPARRLAVARASAIALCLAVALLLPALVPSARAHADLILQIDDLTKQIAAAPRDTDLLLRRGDLHRIHLDWTNAMADFDHVLTIQPGHPGVDLAKGRLMADAGWLVTARAHLDRFIASQPKHAEAYSTRARLLSRLQLHHAAAEDYAQAIRHTPDAGPELFIERAQALAALSPEFHLKALQGLDEGIQRLGPLVTLQLYAIDLELKTRNYDGALTRIDRIAEKSPRKESWLARRGEILVQAGRPQEARAAYQSALAALGNLPPVRRNVPAMAQLEKRLRSQLESLGGPLPQPPK
jgi:tetratricopeptide (TPR) repeat protein